MRRFAEYALVAAFISMFVSQVWWASLVCLIVAGVLGIVGLAAFLFGQDDFAPLSGVALGYALGVYVLVPHLMPMILGAAH